MKQLIYILLAAIITLGFNVQPQLTIQKNVHPLCPSDTSARDVQRYFCAKVERQDSVRTESSKAIADLEDLEQRLRLTVYNMPYEVDEVSGLKLVFVKTDECDARIARAVDYVLLVNEKNEVVWVIQDLVRHDTEEGRFFGVRVSNGALYGELRISEIDAIHLQDFLFVRGASPLINCSDIRFKVLATPDLAPFLPTRQKIPRFFDCQESD